MKKVLRSCLLGIPLIIAVAGFMLAGEVFGDAVFYGLCMYGMEYQDPTPNLLTEIARWIAPLATLSGMLMLFSAVRYRIRAFVRYLRQQSVAVYGPERKEVLAQLGAKGIDGREDFSFVRAQSYILMGSEEENFLFYQKNRAALAGAAVYFQCRSLPAQSVADAKLRLFCPEETAARLFWKQRELYRDSAACGHQMKVVFIGCGILGEQLLTYALQNNIFDPNQHIEYHIFGDGRHFLGVHPELSAISDPVIYHGEPGYRQIPLLEEAKAVIVLAQKGQMGTVQDLLAATLCQKIDVFTANEMPKLLESQGRLRIFDWKGEAQKLPYILSDTLFERAKRINLRYAVLYGGAADTEADKEEQWAKLDGFTRYSNISAADYHEVRLKMLAAVGEDPEHLGADCLEALSELEHIRWCRYHQLNNWRCGQPGDGRHKDAARRIHTDLVPYEALSDGEKEKDRENIRILLSVE